MNKHFLICAFLIVQACAQKPWYGDLDYLGSFPNSLSEVSGLACYDDQLWVIEDNGNKDHIYQVNMQGKLVKDFKVKNADNKDWEDLARDKTGNLYIGDFGNNDNYRKDLVIYKLPNPQTESGDKIDAKKIKFQYPEQKRFPPKKAERFYDAEAFLHYQGHLYIFTKDRSKPYQGKTLVYRIPDVPGTYNATRVGEINLCNNPDNCSVTGADITADGKSIALIGYGYVYLLRDVDFKDFSTSVIETIHLKLETQIESVCFLDNDTLLIADEQSKTKGRNLYRYSLK